MTEAVRNAIAEEARPQREKQHGVKELPRSTPVGGRWWKPVQKKRFSAIKKKSTKAGVNMSWKRKLEERERRRQVKLLEQELKEAQKRKLEEEKEKRLEKRKRKAENTFKNMKLQPIKNLAKIKKMNKKQLRTVKRTAIDKDGNVTLVGAYE